jgi:hypothetical protein
MSVAGPFSSVPEENGILRQFGPRTNNVNAKAVLPGLVLVRPISSGHDLQGSTTRAKTVKAFSGSTLATRLCLHASSP